MFFVAVLYSLISKLISTASITNYKWINFFSSSAGRDGMKGDKGDSGRPGE